VPVNVNRRTSLKWHDRGTEAGDLSIRARREWRRQPAQSLVQRCQCARAWPWVPRFLPTDAGPSSTSHSTTAPPAEAAIHPSRDDWNFRSDLPLVSSYLKARHDSTHGRTQRERLRVLDARLEPGTIGSGVTLVRSRTAADGPPTMLPIPPATATGLRRRTACTPTDRPCSRFWDGDGSRGRLVPNHTSPLAKRTIAPACEFANERRAMILS
jgi:hypothetical protein